MLEDYLHIDLKKFGYFSGFVILVAVSTTVLYWFVFGFDTWKRNVQTASDLMLAATPGTLHTGPMVGGQAGNLGMRPAAAAIMPTQQQPNAMTGQFVCPAHGAVGLPRYNQAGAPVCPYGDQIMQFNSAGSNNYALAAGG